jgi:hypothetical protein
LRVSGRAAWWFAKLLEGAGLVVILVGVLFSMGLGFQDRGLESMQIESRGLAIGAGLFAAGWLVERSLRSR